MNTVTLSSARHDWETPKAFFDVLNSEFAFTLDAAASDENALCNHFFTEADDALTRMWLGTVFLNPPYGPGIGKWVKKAYEESQRYAARVVMLIPARTETRWWHSYVMHAAEIRLIKGRLRFSGMTINAPFPSAVVVFQRGDHVPLVTAMDRILDPVATP